MIFVREFVRFGMSISERTRTCSRAEKQSIPDRSAETMYSRTPRESFLTADVARGRNLLGFRSHAPFFHFLAQLVDLLID